MAIFTIEQYQAIAAAYAEGALTVKYQDKQVTYRSLDEMERIMSRMERDLGLSSSGPRRTIAVHDKGF